MQQHKDITGQKVGRLTAIAPSKQRHRSGRTMWTCLCECGTTVDVETRLLSGRRPTSSCGCILLEKNRSRPVRDQRNISHGECGNKKGARTPEYHSWASMLQRCRDRNHSNYKSYGLRGITVCEQWAASYEAFLADMGRRPSGYSLDRIDVNGNYEPGNCRWAPRRIQFSNKRSNRFVVVDGLRRTIQETARETGVPARTVLNWANKVAPSEDITAFVLGRAAQAKHRKA